MKNIIPITITALAICACTSVKQIGSVNMISTRNVSMKESYQLVKSYAGSGKRDLNRYKGQTVDDAINNLVRSVPGGEFLMNVKLYLIDGLYFAVEGDVYGLAQDRNFKGWKVGDKVVWRDNFSRFSGVITDLKNDEECTVKDDAGRMRTVRYAEMSKAE